ncbi:MAG: hypothetical protein V3S89_07895, partial [Desulfobacterales bacterium]
MAMDEDNTSDIDDSSDLFELDKIEVPEKITDDTDGGAIEPTQAAEAVEAVETAHVAPIAPPVNDPEIASRKKPREKAMLMTILAISAIVVIAVSYFIGESRKARDASQPQGNTHQTIGPIVANLDQERRIRISLSIKYDTEMAHASALQARTENNILMLLTS